MKPFAYRIWGFSAFDLRNCLYIYGLGNCLSCYIQYDSFPQIMHNIMSKMAFLNVDSTCNYHIYKNKCQFLFNLILKRMTLFFQMRYRKYKYRSDLRKQCHFVLGIFILILTFFEHYLCV